MKNILPQDLLTLFFISHRMSFIKFLVILILLEFAFSLNTNAQKPKKIFNYLQENKLNIAIEEYNKISNDKKYDDDEKVLFVYAKCLFQIDTNYQKYNPIQSIKEFNNTQITQEIKDDIYKFLGKYTLSPEVINQKIINEIYREAVKLNTVESYTNALNYYSKEHNDNTIKLLEIATYNRVKSNKAISQLKNFISKYPESNYKIEIQNLLERVTLNNYKSINNIDSLNQFITKFDSSEYKKEAIDFRDSLVLSKVPENYDSMLAYTQKYPDSKFKKEVENRLPEILYKEVESNRYSIEFCKKFLDKYEDDYRVEILDSIIFNKAKKIDSVYAFNNYLTVFKKGRFINSALKKIDDKTVTHNKIINCYNLDSLNLFLECENLLNYSNEYIYQICLTLSIKKLKENLILKKVKEKNLAEKIFQSYDALNQIDDPDEDKYIEKVNSEKIINELKRENDIQKFFKSNSYADSVENVNSAFSQEFAPYINKGTWSDAVFSVDAVGNGFVTLFTCYGVRSSINYRIYLVKDNIIQNVDLSHFEYTMKNHLLNKFPLHDCYSIIKAYETVKNKNEMIIYGEIYRTKRSENTLDSEFDAVCCPSYVFKTIANIQNNKFIIKKINSTKSKN